MFIHLTDLRNNYAFVLPVENIQLVTYRDGSDRCPNPHVEVTTKHPSPVTGRVMRIPVVETVEEIAKKLDAK